MLKCAAGQVIPDELYDPRMEELPVFSIIGPFMSFKELVLSRFGHDGLAVITFGQRSHDQAVTEMKYSTGGKPLEIQNALFLEGFEDRMRRLAARHNLIYTPA